MFPLGDASRETRRWPLVTILIIAANFAVFALELANGDDFILRWSLVPANIVAGRDWITILSSMFLHEGWEHILGNMLFLWAFGPEIEDAMGGFRYFVFYLLGGLAATIAQVAIDPSSTVPQLGASGAIAAVMGAFLVTYPRDQIKTVFVLGWIIRVTFVPAAVLVGLWFVSQLFNEVGSLMKADSGGGVAYMAHIGGFVFGAVMARLFERSDDPGATGERRWAIGG
ncbi:MAG TPA: rhomboid family intramembrane serine protease [Candidatus Dormibacteraeota bacterium]|nr:rhomboid family intramembrane serine protease [Candidatus Dormibacteraeota bacterium]